MSIPVPPSHSDPASSPAPPRKVADGCGVDELARRIADGDEGVGDAVFCTDLEGVITGWSLEAEQLYGFNAGEAIGRAIWTLSSPDHRQPVQSMLATVGKGDPVDRHEAPHVTLDGRSMRLSLMAAPRHDESGVTIGATIVARNADRRDPDERRWRLLCEMGSALSGQLEGEQVLRELAKRLVPDLADYCVTYLLEGERIMRVGAAHADPAHEASLLELVGLRPPQIEDEMGAGAVIRTGSPVLATDIPPQLLIRAGTSAEYLRILQVLAPISSMILPLRARGRTLGAVAMATSARSNRRYWAQDLAQAQEFADRAALALDNARLFQEAQSEIARREAAEDALRRQYEQLRVLYELTQVVSRASDLEEIYGEALDALRRTLGVDRASILLFDGEGKMRFKAWRGLSDGYRAAVDGHSPWTVDSVDPTPVFIEGVATSPGLSDDLREAIHSEGIRAMAFIPLVFGPKLLGKFMLYHDQPHEFGSEELELARTVAGTVAFAITRVHDESSVRQAKEEAERANEAKSHFLGVMSHELRTPLNAIGGYVELLELGVHGTANPKQKEALSRIAANQRHLLGLINDILSFARLEAGQVEYDIGPLPVAETLDHLDALVAPMAAAKGTEYVLEPTHPELMMLGDGERIHQILLNLVSNAIKFTQEGGRVNVAAVADDGWVLIGVRDNGPGIAPEYHERIFDPFTQVDRRLHHRRDGAGLGLAISRELARGMGGDLELESTPGAGSRFTLRLPLLAGSITAS